MADPKIFIRRSATPNKVPTVDQLALGELAINTYDGKLYLEQDQGAVGVGITIVAVNPWSVGVGSTAYNIYFTAGSVGIGTTISTSKLDVVGDVKVSGVVTAATASVSTISLSAVDITSTSTTTTTTVATSVASVSATVCRSAVFQVQAVQGTNYNMTTINVLHDGSETYMTEYGTINQPIGIATFSTDINAGSLRLLAHPASNNSTTFKILTKALDI